jgi:hypothetical protein
VTEGAQQTSPDSNNEIDGTTVTRTTTIDGQPAYVTRNATITRVYFKSGQFAVVAAGSNGATAAELVTLIESMHGLR